jgi:hypothetical protein
MPTISTSTSAHPIAIAMQNNSLGKRTSFDELYDIHDSHNSSGISFGSSPIRQSPLH